MKVQLTFDEWYPVYKLGRGPEMEVPEEIVARWQSAYDTFMAAQDEMEKYYDDYYANREDKP